jgi:chemotaxis protein histidine kinase CheA
VELTHALEMAFDGIRKNELVVNSHLVDICLDAVDALRLLRDGKTDLTAVSKVIDMTYTDD